MNWSNSSNTPILGGESEKNVTSSGTNSGTNSATNSATNKQNPKQNNSVIAPIVFFGSILCFMFVAKLLFGSFYSFATEDNTLWNAFLLPLYAVMLWVMFIAFFFSAMSLTGF